MVRQVVVMVGIRLVDASRPAFGLALGSRTLGFSPLSELVGPLFLFGDIYLGTPLLISSIVAPEPLLEHWWSSRGSLL